MRAIFLVQQVVSNIWSVVSIILGPLLGASVGVYLGFWKNRMHQKEQDHDKKLFLLSSLRHDVRKSIELLHEKHRKIIPVDAWNSIVNSGNIEGFDLVLVNEALNSCVNIFNLYSGFLAYFTPKLAY